VSEARRTGKLKREEGWKLCWQGLAWLVRLPLRRRALLASSDRESEERGTEDRPLPPLDPRRQLARRRSGDIAERGEGRAERAETAQNRRAKEQRRSA
jgi:hypothetical protein